jgi:hypothetical protein
VCVCVPELGIGLGLSLGLNFHGECSEIHAGASVRGRERVGVVVSACV